MLQNIGKDAGATAADTVKTTVEEATSSLAADIPAVGTQGKDIVDHLAMAGAGLIAELRNTLNGATLPVDITATITVRITGQVGALKLTVPE